MNQVSRKVFSHTHYGVSTIAAVIYAIAWLVGNQVHAEMNHETTNREAMMLPAVVVTAQRAIVATTLLEPVVVNGKRVPHASYATLAPVVVVASRDVLTASNSQIGAVVNTNLTTHATASATHKPGLVTKVRTWVRGWISGPRV